MIIIEGPDMVGKTTLAQALLKACASEGLHHVYCHLSKLHTNFDEVLDYKPLMNRYAIYDRFYMSRQAYGKALNNQRVLTSDHYRLLDAWARLHGAFHVVVVATEDFVREQFARIKRDEMYAVDAVVQVNAMYKAMLDDQHDRPMDVDYIINTPGDGWPSQHVDSIMHAYKLRLDAITQVLQRKVDGLCRFTPHL